MPIPPPPTPAERFATLVLWLTKAVAAGIAGGRISGRTIVLVWQRISRIGQRFSRLAARIRAGRFRPRASPGPRPGRPPGRPNALPTGFGWLVPLVPGAGAFAAQLRYLLADPEMAALLAAAPAAMGRTLRPLCRMLGVRPPPILAAAAPPEPPPPAAPATAPPEPPPPAAPASAAAATRPPPPPRRRKTPAPPYPARGVGPPHPA